MSSKPETEKLPEHYSDDDLRCIVQDRDENDADQDVGAVAPVAWEYRVRGIDAIWARGEGSINSDYNDEYWEVRYLYDRPASPAHTSEARDAEIDDAALDIARRFTLDTEPQRRASLQVAIVEAMHRASNRSQS